MIKLFWVLFFVVFMYPQQVFAEYSKNKKLMVKALDIVKGIKGYEKYVLLSNNGFFRCTIKIGKNRISVYRGNYTVSDSISDLDNDGFDDVVLIIANPLYVGCIEKITLIVLKNIKNTSLKPVFINNGFIPNSNFSVTVQNGQLNIRSSRGGSILGNYDDISYDLSMKLHKGSMHFHSFSYDSTWELEAGSTPTSYHYDFENNKYDEHMERIFLNPLTHKNELVEYKANGTFELKQNETSEYFEYFEFEESGQYIDKIIRKFPDKESRVLIDRE